jgi:hypothetical protein
MLSLTQPFRELTMEATRGSSGLGVPRSSRRDSRTKHGSRISHGKVWAPVIKISRLTTVNFGCRLPILRFKHPYTDTVSRPWDSLPNRSGDITVWHTFRRSRHLGGKLWWYTWSVRDDMEGRLRLGLSYRKRKYVFSELLTVGGLNG